eukprot:scaffold3127_cov202-Prasinococcus_capsulatus_cf.AAC.16
MSTHGMEPSIPKARCLCDDTYRQQLSLPRSTATREYARPSISENRRYALPKHIHQQDTLASGLHDEHAVYLRHA